MTAATLDWCCIGAQKAGTSTLYRLLREHPQIAIPSSKEDPIFDAETNWDAVEDYLNSRFRDVVDARCGTVTPQYLSDPGTAARMHRHVPDAQIIVLLRDPVSRALSHYKMSVLRGLESRPFSTAVAEQLMVLREGGLPDLASETDTYLVRGRYAWLLREWFNRYGAEAILPVFSATLDRDTLSVVSEVHRFLGVEPHQPSEADFRFNAAPPPHRLSSLRRPVAVVLRRVGWDRVHPERREKVSSFVERSLARVVPMRATADLGSELHAELRAYFAPEDTALADLLARPLPWTT